MVHHHVPRPFGITLLMIYGFIVGVTSIAGGIFLLLDHNSSQLLTDSFNTPNQLVAAGIVSIIIGSIQLLLASALGHANNTVRIVYAVVASLNLAAGLWATVALSGEQRASGVMTVVFAVLVLYLLFNHRADEYFEHSHDELAIPGVPVKLK